MANYLTTEEADTYFADSLNSLVGAWLTADAADKDKALTMATRIINQLNFRGSKTSESQENEFPRGENSYTPDEIGYACAEIALALLDGFDPNIERENLSVTSEKLGDISSSYDKRHREHWKMSNVPSIIAWNYLLPFLAGKTSLKLNRV